MFHADEASYHRIVVEGCDGTGKSTMVKKLEEFIPGSMTVHWTSPPKLEPLKTYHDYIQRLLNLYLRIGKEVKNHIIYDRALLSELIYAPIIKGYDMSKLEHFYTKAFLNQGWKIIVCTADLGVVIDRVFNRGDWLITKKERLIDIYNAYNKYIHTTDLPMYIYDSTHQDKNDPLPQSLIQFLKG